MKLEAVDKKKQQPVHLVIDLGTASVGGSLFIENPSAKKPEIIKSVRLSIGREQAVNLRDFLNQTKKTIGEVVERLIGKDYLSVQSINCILAAPYYLAKTEFIHYQDKNKHLKFTPNLLNRLVEQKAATLIKDHPKLYQEIISDQSCLLEKEIMMKKLNGYPVEQAKGQIAHRLNLAVYYSLTSEAVLNQLEDILHLYTDRHVSVCFHSLVKVLAEVAPTLIPNRRNYIILDASGELTDIAVVRNKVLSGHLSFPVGTKTILRLASETAGSSIEEIKSRLVLQSSGDLKQTEVDKLDKILETAKIKWLAGLKDSLNLVKETTMLPENILILTDELSADSLIKWIKDENWKEYTLSTGSFNVKPLRSSVLKSFCLADNSLSDPFLLMETLFCQSQL
ncbi:MAG: hypothetical protein ACOCU8_00175 [Patescibacteria group bacterium]